MASTFVDARVDREDRLKGPIIRWLDHGSEGWQPESFPTVKAALEADRYHSCIITRRIDYDVVERIDPANCPEAAKGPPMGECPRCGLGPCIYERKA